MTLLFCNKTEKDIILRKELEALHPRLKVNFMLEDVPPGWKGLQGRPNLTVLNEIHSLNDEETFYLYCGPPAMNLAITKIFQQNHPKANYHKI
jgi:NAD(P)H-flavin reductase